jgi:hypothetical protein
MKRFAPNKRVDPPPAPTNGDRAVRAEIAVNAYWGSDAQQEPIGDRVSDLLADLMHLCHRDHVDFEVIFDRASRRFEEEQ